MLCGRVGASLTGSLDRTVFNRELYGVWGGLSEEDRQKLIGFPKVK
jgi:hypothetical protein